MMNKLLLWFFFSSLSFIEGEQCRHNVLENNKKSERRTTYRGRYTREATFGKNYEIVVPRKVRSDGRFISHQIPHHYKRSYYKGKKREELTSDDALHYRLPIEGEEYHLELYPNHRLIGPGAVVEERATPSRNSARATGDFIDNTRFKKLRDTQCHYLGRVRDQRDVTALSTCYGLAGYIRTKRSLYMIEPIENHNFNIDTKHPHIVYRHGDCGLDQNSTLLCNTTSNLARSIVKDSRILAKRNPSPEAEIRAYTIEILAVLDQSLLNYHRVLDVENYVLTLFNMAAGLFQDVSLGVQMELVLVRIIRLEVEEVEMNLSVNKDIEATMKYFQEWQKKMNPGDDTHPNHHDCAILISKIDICIAQNLCTFTGVSTIAGTCDPLKGAVVIKDSGLETGYEIAHHLGHTVGMSHDAEDENGCSGIIPHDDYLETTVMHPGYHYVTKKWSKCSQTYLKLYIDAGLANCLLDEAEDHNFPTIEMLPGVMYGADDQCRLRYRDGARQCDFGITCSELKCKIPSMGCISSNKPPAEGTPCGEKRWCYDMKCLVIGERPSVIDGQWSSWSAWSHCSRTCGSGVAFSQRKCNNPTPSNGGKYCSGEWTRHKICATTPCDIGAPSFRDVQCSEFNEWIFPEDGKVHQWVGYNLPENLKASENPCVLYCLSETKLLTSLKTKVVDGTTCYRGIRDICVGGVCREIPCDLDMESNAIEDMCGVCKGDSTSCVLKEGVINFEPLEKLRKVIEVPIGAKNIRVEETQPSRSRIVVRNKKSKNVLIDGNRLGMFDVPGSKAWLGMIRAKQEALNIPGPVTEELIVLIHPREKVTLKYSLGLKRDVQRKASFEWGYIDWSHCSAACGPGEQVSKPSCIEKIGGLVDDKFCKKIAKPEVKVRTCNQAACVPRWMIGDWQGCVPCTGSCKKIRAVKCVRPVGHGEQEADVIADGYCEGPKPKESETKPCREIREEASVVEPDDSRGRKEVEVVVGSDSIGSNDSSLGLLLNGAEKNKSEIASSTVGTRRSLKNEEKILGTDSNKIERIDDSKTLDKHKKRSTEGLKSSNMSSTLNDTEKKRHERKEFRGTLSLKKGLLAVDKEDVRNLTLTIIIERDDKNNIINFPKDFQPQPPQNVTEFSLVGMDAVKYIQWIQEEGKTISEIPLL